MGLPPPPLSASVVAVAAATGAAAVVVVLEEASVTAAVDLLDNEVEADEEAGRMATAEASAWCCSSRKDDRTTHRENVVRT